MDIAKTQAKLIFIRDNINEVMREVMEENESLQALAIKLNREQLSNQGVDSTGTKLGSYADRSAYLRSQAGLQTNFIDLNFSGDFQDQFIIQDATGDSIFSINSENWKRNILVERLGTRPGFGEDIFGLTKENLEVLKDAMREPLKAKIAQLLNA